MNYNPQPMVTPNNIYLDRYSLSVFILFVLPCGVIFKIYPCVNLMRPNKQIIKSNSIHTIVNIRIELGHDSIIEPTNLRWFSELTFSIKFIYLDLILQIRHTQKK